MTQPTLTKAEQIFISRMVPHIEAGKSFADAARAVLEDDERIWLAATASDEIGKSIRSEMAAEVYSRLQAA